MLRQVLIDLGKEAARLFDFRCGAVPVGLEVPEGCQGVLPGVGEAAGSNEDHGKIAACSARSEAVALRLPVLDARRDRGDKLALYAETGIREYWIVDPAESQIEFLVNEGGRFVVALPAGAEYRSVALPELHLDLLAFWREVDETLAGA